MRVERMKVEEMILESSFNHVSKLKRRSHGLASMVENVKKLKRKN